MKWRDVGSGDLGDWGDVACVDSKLYLWQRMYTTQQIDGTTYHVTQHNTQVRTKSATHNDKPAQWVQTQTARRCGKLCMRTPSISSTGGEAAEGRR